MQPSSILNLRHNVKLKLLFRSQGQRRCWIKHLSTSVAILPFIHNSLEEPCRLQIIEEPTGTAGELYLWNNMFFGSPNYSSGEVAHHLTVLTSKIDDIAQRAGVSAVDRLDLEVTLAALPWPSRRRLGLILESARVSTNDQAIQKAVAVMLELAADVWARTPPPIGEAAETHRRERLLIP